MKEKIEHFTGNQYFKEKLQPRKLFFMHNLSANFRLFLETTKLFSDRRLTRQAISGLTHPGQRCLTGDTCFNADS